MSNGVILFNPRSAEHKFRIPNSILQVGASIHGQREYVFVDGNRERDPWSTIEKNLATGRFKYFGSTVMPGPQLRQAIPFSKLVRESFPEVKVIWGGYFAANPVSYTHLDVYKRQRSGRTAFGTRDVQSVAGERHGLRSRVVAVEEV